MLLQEVPQLCTLDVSLGSQFRKLVVLVVKSKKFLLCTLEVGRFFALLHQRSELFFCSSS
jgi:hypothetical protein